MISTRRSLKRITSVLGKFQRALMFLALFVCPTTLFAAPLTSAVLPATELTMSGYQAAQLEHDLPIQTLAIDASGVVWLAGRTSVWRWNTADSSVQRIGLVDAIGEGRSGQSVRTLQTLGNDGLSLFAAAGERLFQIQGQPRRVLLYTADLPTTSHHSLGFAGSGDDFWWVTTGGAFRFDRYGKRLVRAPRTLKLQPSDAIALDPKSTRLWVARGTKLVSIDLATQGSKAVEVVKTASALRGVQFSNGELVAWTARAFMRFDAAGRRLQTIPVEGTRALQGVVLSPDAHSFLFSDGLVERFDLRKEATHRYRLPVNAVANEAVSSDRMKFRRSGGGFVLGGGDLLGVVANGRPRLFRLARENVEK